MNKNLFSVAMIGLMMTGLAITGPVNAQETTNMTSQPTKSAMVAQDNKEKPVLVTTGKFHKVSHNTVGTATIYENPDGSRELKLTGFSTAEGPAVHVYLVAAGDAKDNASVKKAGFLDLGKLKSRKGNQTYKVPAEIDLWKYRAVTIWCDKFSVNFGTAPLAAKQ